MRSLTYLARHEFVNGDEYDLPRCVLARRHCRYRAALFPGVTNPFVYRISANFLRRLTDCLTLPTGGRICGPMLGGG